ncbi:hypothetical protein L596_030053 [Steinernema carpocapsae]|uniref:Glycine N-acyltransferase-like protein n=1 Tax=Steinernema carpocapsae TaxID=34508 RepID=A0A4U5LRL3_STECR|nr:hypothetical protein L596_030053 [Steinernema carpocapsae]
MLESSRQGGAFVVLQNTCKSDHNKELVCLEAFDVWKNSPIAFQMAFQIPEDSLESILSQLYIIPQLVIIYDAVKQFGTLKLFGYPKEKPVLWLVSKKPTYFKNIIHIQATTDRKEILEHGCEALFNLLKKDIIEMDKILFVASDRTLELVSKEMSKLETHPFISRNIPRSLFYMDKDQCDKVLKERLTLPEGFIFVDLDPDSHADMIKKLEIGTQDPPYTRERILKMPSVGVKHEKSDQIVSFEYCSGHGLLIHHFTFPEFRRQGLGRAVELRLCQKIILELGIVPVKHVSRLSANVIDMSKRSPFWTTCKNDDGSDYLGYFRIYEKVHNSSNSLY